MATVNQSRVNYFYSSETGRLIVIRPKIWLVLRLDSILVSYNIKPRVESPEWLTLSSNGLFR